MAKITNYAGDDFFRWILDTTIPGQTIHHASTTGFAYSAGGLQPKILFEGTGLAYNRIDGQPVLTDHGTITHVAYLNGENTVLVDISDVALSPIAALYYFASDDQARIQQFLDTVDNQFQGGDGIDIFQGSAQTDLAFGGGSVDGLSGGAGDDVLWGEAGNDDLYGGAGSDTMIGGSGHDGYYVTDLDDIVDESTPGSDGDDTVVSTISLDLSTSHNFLGDIERFYLGGDYEGLGLIGDDRDNYFQGNDGNNVLDGRGGVDTLDGGNGTDTYHVDNSDDVLSHGADGDPDTLYTSASYAIAAGQEIAFMYAENVRSTKQMYLFGNEFDQRIVGTVGANTLGGGGGDDTLQGLGGNDTYFVHARDTIIESVGGGTRDAVTVLDSFVFGDDLETERINAGYGVRDLTGNRFAQFLNGNAEDNRLDGGAGADTMRGILGDDRYAVDNVGDVVIEYVRCGYDSVFSKVSYTLSAYVEELRLTGTGNLDATGNASLNLLLGNSGDNILDGQSGADTMRGGAGADTYVVDDIHDVIVEQFHYGSDTVRASVSTTLADNVEALVLSGNAAIRGNGNALGNAITGNDAANRLNGLAGADTIIGGGGDDVVIFSTIDAIDRLADFAPGHDRIAFVRDTFSGLHTGALSAASFGYGSVATAAHGQILYDKATGFLAYDADGAGGAPAIHFATLAASLALTAADFVVV